MTRFLLIVLAILLAVRALFRLLGGIVEGPAPAPRSRGANRGELMVRDPVCGTFVVRARAVTSGRDDDVRYFCSEKCRREYLSRARS